MVKVEYHDIADGGTLNYLVEVEGTPLVIFNGKLKSKYKKYFGLKGIDIFSLTGAEAIKHEHLRPKKMGGGRAKKDRSTPLFGELPNVFKS